MTERSQGPGRPGSDSRLDELAARLTAVERRLAALEGRPSPRPELPAEAPARAPAAAEAAPPKAAAPARAPRAETVALIGRMLLILAGAFILRAITQRPGEAVSGVLPQGVGTTLGVAYAMLWAVMAEIAARRGRRAAAAFHGVAGGLIAFPLLWEATVHFDLLTPAASAAVLFAVTALGLAVAFRRSLPALSWMFGLGAATTALAIAVPTKTLMLFVPLVLLLALAALWSAYVREGWGLAWVLAAVADASVVLMTAMVLLGSDAQRVAEHFTPGALVSLQLALVVVYCVSFGAHTLWRNEDVRAGEMIQGAAAVVIGLGGAIAVAWSTGTGGASVGAVALLLAAGAYGVSFTFVDRREGIRNNFIFYATLALLFTFAAFEALCPGPWLTSALAVAAVVTAWIGARRRRATLSGHGAFYAIGAIATSGAAVLGIEAFAGPTVPPVAGVTLSVVVALAAAAVCCWFRVARHGRTWGRLSPVPKFAVLAFLALGLGGIVVVLLATLVPMAESGRPDAGLLALLRTAVLAVSVVVLARVGRWPRLAEATWLVYPVLILGGVKWVMEDLPAGSPATLGVSLAFYAGALILGPRWARKKTAGGS